MFFPLHRGTRKLFRVPFDEDYKKIEAIVWLSVFVKLQQSKRFLQLHWLLPTKQNDHDFNPSRKSGRISLQKSYRPSPRP